MKNWVQNTAPRCPYNNTQVLTDNKYLVEIQQALMGDKVSLFQEQGTRSADGTSSNPLTRDAETKEAGLSSVGKELLDSRFVVNTEEDVRAVYDKWAKSYDEDSFSALQFDSPTQCALRTLAHWPRAGNGFPDYQDECSNYAEGVRVLDVGCGTGALSELLHRHSGFSRAVCETTELHGFDLSDEMLKVASNSGRYSGSLRTQSLTAYPWPYAGDSMDLVMCNGVLIYVDDPECMEEFCRVLKPGGKAILMMRQDGYHVYSDKITQMETEGKWRLVDVSETRNNFPKARQFSSGDTQSQEDVFYNIYVFVKMGENELRLQESLESAMHAKQGHVKETVAESIEYRRTVG